MNWLVEVLNWLIRACTRAWTFIVTELLPMKRHPERIVRSLRIGQNHPKTGLHREEDYHGPVKDHNSLLENVFQFFDMDGSGHISRGEIRNGLRDMGHNPDEREINLLLAKIDTDGNGIVDNEELIAFMRSHISLDDPEGDLGTVFRMLDKGDDGLVSGRDVRAMVSKHATRQPDPVVGDILAAFKDGANYNYQEFLAVITQGEEPHSTGN